MEIGIPRALFYWKKISFWETFFKILGCKVLLSDFTNQKIIEEGTKIADPETCFSLKVFFGHLLDLENKVDFIFLPRLKKNNLGLEYCPKFFALPDLAPLFLKTKVLTLEIDESKKPLKEILINLAKKIGKKENLAKKAFEKACLIERERYNKLKKEYLQRLSGKEKKILLISHPYNLYDEYLNLRIKEKLEKLGAKVIFIDEVIIEKKKEETKNKDQEIDFPKFHWEFAQEMLEKVKEIANKKIDGAIEISAFQCGCDAVLKEFIEKEFKQRKIPFLYLIIDEHTAEAGLQTRLEAFFDTLT
jgi:predicted nucleotide-binding protein (sugar kinase/HSP70/actin superfamily)